MVLITSIATILLFFSFGQSQAVTSTNASGMAAQRNSSTKMFKVVYLIDKIQNHTLYLENKKQYDLRNVKVTRLSGGSNRFSQKKWAAEMLFINGVLKEVNIR